MLRLKTVIAVNEYNFRGVHAAGLAVRLFDWQRKFWVRKQRAKAVTVYLTI